MKRITHFTTVAYSRLAITTFVILPSSWLEMLYNAMYISTYLKFGKKTYFCYRKSRCLFFTTYKRINRGASLLVLLLAQRVKVPPPWTFPNCSVNPGLIVLLPPPFCLSSVCPNESAYITRLNFSNYKLYTWSHYVSVLPLFTGGNYLEI